MYARLFADKCPLRPTAIQCTRSFCSQVPPPQTEVALVRLAPSGWLPLAGRLPLPGDGRPLSRSGPLVPGAAWRAPSSPQCGPHVLRDSRRSGATSETSEWTRKETGAPGPPARLGETSARASQNVHYQIPIRESRTLAPARLSSAGPRRHRVVPPGLTGNTDRFCTQRGAVTRLLTTDFVNARRRPR